ncbi:hypothetical protein ABZ835_37645 [Streptomyces sp. NPDC047461]|uniref:hypothetical protein n=1 Tax=Streptomyces sp. NPDC047461 TaxID=3155619 RepID=UPI0033CFA723
MERKTRPRPATPAERLAARALGRPEPEEIELDVTSSADVHAARLLDPRPSRKPRGMATSEWFARRALGGAEGPDAA